MSAVRAWYAARVPDDSDYIALTDRLDHADIAWRLFVNALPGGRTVVTIDERWAVYGARSRGRWVFDTATGRRLDDRPRSSSS